MLYTGITCYKMDGASITLESLPNFRQAGGPKLYTKNGRRVKDGLLYRSSRTDFVTEKDLEELRRLGIRTILDLRPKRDYQRDLAEGDGLVDNNYCPYIVKTGQVRKLQHADPTRRGRLRRRKTHQQNGADAEPAEEPAEAKGIDESEYAEEKRFIVDLWTKDLIWYVFRKLNVFVRFLSLSLAVVDWICGSHLFVKFYAWAVLNKVELWESYLDILEHCKGPVVDAIRVIADERNLPLLVHCAHGKDRTGVIIALVLGALGVEEGVIVEDYAKSEDGLEPIRERVFAEVVLRYGFREEFMCAEAATMRRFLECLKDRYGSVCGYLESAGFSTEEQQNLQRLFLEE